jgi:large subunit ribosomal protein L18
MNSKHRAQRVRYKLRSCSNGRIRLSVFKSIKHIYVQAIDDSKQITLASASSNDKDFDKNAIGRKSQAMLVGKIIAEKLLKANVKDVYLDRGRYAYGGVIASLAQAARDNGLNF